MKARSVLPALVLLTAVMISAACTQSGPKAGPVPPATVTVTPAPVAVITTVAAGLPAAEPAGTITLSPPPLPVTPVQVLTGYRSFRDPLFSFEYPASWQSNRTTRLLPEYVHDMSGCRVTTYYETYEDQRFFVSPDRNAIIFTSVVRTRTNIWPRDLDGEINYADVVNRVIGDQAHCANTPAGTIRISGVAPAAMAGVSYRATRVDFGKNNSTGFVDGSGTMFMVTGRNNHGIFGYYETTGSSGTWGKTGEKLSGTLTLDPDF
ncbi:MAG: hypothetical protein A4E35_01713 [Methanoregula sp. PtaU1.Bin051]|nr:MAG: hypothetical protein A4E35_01713 [Methanoregula sp. PtaU1.Bin051]